MTPISMNVELQNNMINLVDTYNIKEICAEFEGYSDDGFINDIEIKCQDDIEIPKDNAELIEVFILRVVSNICAGWEIDGGATGEITVTFVDSKTAKVSFSIAQCYQEYDCWDREVTFVLDGR